jgi:transcriptional regulator with XRE-family HTH domain
VAARAGVSRQVISRIECNELRAVQIGTIARVLQALDASADLTVRWRGEALDRLMDSAHAALVERCVSLLRDRGWLTRVEVSFNHFGDRGRVDVLAFHGDTRTALVVEAKSAIGDEQETHGRLDVKARLGTIIAESVGWHAAVVVPALVIAESRTARRIVGGHGSTFARFDVRGRKALAWLRHPVGAVPTGLLWFVELPDSRGVSVARSARVRTARSAR